MATDIFAHFRHVDHWTDTNVPVPSQEETAPPGTHEPEGEVEGNQSSVVIKVMHNPTYGGDLPQGASDQGTSEAELDHHYENTDDPQESVKIGNAASKEETEVLLLASSSVPRILQAFMWLCSPILDLQVLRQDGYVKVSAADAVG
ncbi:hypothetical protein Bbelb_377460 [Branchiostoma belcheri]|nr:hypothetical protein Bbelb_377460 [Branchiostoma belcheri]